MTGLFGLPLAWSLASDQSAHQYGRSLWLAACATTRVLTRPVSACPQPAQYDTPYDQGVVLYGYPPYYAWWFFQRATQNGATLVSKSIIHTASKSVKVSGGEPPCTCSSS